MQIQGAIFVGSIVGIVIGICSWMYGMWKTREWFSFINRHQPAIDQDTDWWGYVIYDKYPGLAMIWCLFKGLIVGAIIAFFLFGLVGCSHDSTVQTLEDLENDNTHIRIGDILYSIGCRGDNPDAYTSTHYDLTYCREQNKTPIAYREWDYKTNTGQYDLEGIPLDELDKDGCVERNPYGECVAYNHYYGERINYPTNKGGNT